MNNIAVLQVNQSFHDLHDDVLGLLLRKAALSSKFLIEVAVLAVVQNDIDVLGVVEIAVELNNVWVVQAPLDLELSLHLAKKVEFL